MHQVPNLYAIKLNNHALALFRANNNIGAEKCLIRALLSSTMNEMPPPADYLAMERERQEKEPLREHLVYSCTFSDDGEEHYNSGMRVYFEPLVIQASSTFDEITIQSTIFFNLGIRYIRSKQYEEAYGHFSKALSLQTTHCKSRAMPKKELSHPPHHGPSNKMVLHNLAYINFVERRYAEAFSNQSEVLRILLKSKGYYNAHVVTCLNSIGIITMHKNAIDQDNSGEKALHFFLEALAIHKAISPPGISCNERRSIIRNTLARIKDIRVQISQQELQEQRKTPQLRHCHSSRHIIGRRKMIRRKSRDEWCECSTENSHCF